MCIFEGFTTFGGRGSVWQLAMVLAWSAAIGLPARAQQPSPAPKTTPQPLIPAEKHLWARHPAGSWAQSRSTIESFDKLGVATTSVETIKSTLKAADATGYTLSIERSVSIDGRQFPLLAYEMTMGLSGEKENETVLSFQTLGESELLVDGRKVPCEVRQAVVNGEGNKRTTVNVYYSPEVIPHALKREWIDAATPEANSSTVIEEVVAIGLPYPVAGQLRSAAFVHTAHKLPGQSKESMEVICNDVPGGVVSQWSKELNAEGKLLRRTTSELLAYQVQPRTMVVPTRSRLDRKRERREEKKVQRRSP